MTRMTPRLTCLAATAVLAIIAAPAAASPTPRSDARLAATQIREARQDTRIAGGLATGRISSAEATRLNARQAGIDNAQARLSADGYFSRRDYARVSYRQTRASYGIARARR